MVRETIAVAATLCGTVPALLPLFEHGLPHTHDGLIHVQRLIALESVIRQGAPFTRWLPNLAYGYGQPLLLYYAPLAYLPALAARFLGAGYATSIEIASGLALVLSALAMYLLARSLFGMLAATVAAIVYAVLPYQLVDVYVRGALAESWAFAWLPLCAWCLIRACGDGRARWSVGLAVTVAGLVLTHNATALLFLPALVALGLLLHLSTHPGWRRVPLRPVSALALGLTLSAWFWLPALAERGLVQIGETIEPDLFASFFVRGWPPFRLDPLYDYQHPFSMALGSAIFWPQLGLVQVVVTVIGGVAAVRTSGAARGVAIWAMLLVLGGYLMQLQPLAPLYDLIPLLTFVQFPWRLLAMIGLGSAILAGVLVESLSARAAIRGVFAAVVVGASLATAVARLDPEPQPVDERMLSVETITRSELADYGLGTTHSGEYLPVGSNQRNAARFRKTLIDAGGERASGAESAPSKLQIGQVAWHPDRIAVDVSTPAPERLMFHQFAFPGWVASLDGAPVSLGRAGQLRLPAVDVPAGRHTVEFAWTWTPLRTGASVVSLVGVLALVPLAAAGRRRPTRSLGIGAAAAIGLGVAVFGAPWLPANTATAQGQRAARAQDVGDGLTLLDARNETSRLATDRLIETRLTWLVRQAPATGYRAFVEVTSSDGQVRHRAPWVYEPLSRLWERGELVPTTVAVRLPADFAAGEYLLRLAFDRPEGITPVPLGSVTVPDLKATPNADSDNLGVGIDVGADVRLSAPLDATRPLQIRPGASLDIPLRWEQVAASPNVERELQVVASLSLGAGNVASAARRPGDWFAPLPFWQRGDVIEQNVRLSLPAWFPHGTYPLVVRVYSRDLARGGVSEPGASSAGPRGRPIAELALGNVTVGP